jgi:hypothetical protein
MATKKRVGKSNKRIFEFFKKTSLYLKKKKLEIAIFRQNVPLSAKIKKDSKKDLLVHHNNCHLLLINVGDPH